jgi:hypothetical protein
MKNRTDYYSWHLSCHWGWAYLIHPFKRDAYLDGGSVEWRVGPFLLQKMRHSRTS